MPTNPPDRIRDAAELPEATIDLTRFRRCIAGGGAGPHDYVLLLGLQTFEWPELLAEVRRGLPYRTLEHFRANTNLPEQTIIRWLHMPVRTLHRRKQQGRFDREESDRLLRAARIFGKALELFEGDRVRAGEWLLSEQPALGGDLPIELADTEIGAREVEHLVGRLEHGVYS